MKIHEVKELQDGIKVMRLKDCYMYYTLIPKPSKYSWELKPEEEVKVLYITEMKEM